MRPALSVRWSTTRRVRRSCAGTPMTFADGRTVAPVHLNQVRWVSHCRTSYNSQRPRDTNSRPTPRLRARRGTPERVALTAERVVRRLESRKSFVRGLFRRNRPAGQKRPWSAGTSSRTFHDRRATRVTCCLRTAASAQDVLPCEMISSSIAFGITRRGDAPARRCVKGVAVRVTICPSAVRSPLVTSV